MIQVILKAAYNAGWGGSAQYFSLSGEGQIPLSSTFGINYANVLVPIAGTFKNLTVYSGDTHPDYVLSLVKNGVNTALAASLASSETSASNITTSISVVAGDYVCMRITVNPPGLGSGYPVSIGIEFEGDEQFYTIQPISGGMSVGGAVRSGMLNNGIWAAESWPISVIKSNYYSINSVVGTITKFAMLSFADLPGAGIWTAYLIKNSILQDGTGGTVDTAISLTGTETYVTKVISLPVVLGDYVEAVYTRTVDPSGFALAQITAAIAFDPTDNESFMNTGGSNNVTSPTVVDYQWNRSEQLEPGELQANVPITLRGLNVTGLYVEQNQVIPGSATVMMLRKNGADTAITFTITYPAVSGQILGQDVDFVFGDVMTLAVTPVPGVATGGESIHWGLITLVDSDPENPGSGIYQLVVGKTTDAVYDSDGIAIDVAIPEPFFKTGILGD